MSNLGTFDPAKALADCFTHLAARRVAVEALPDEGYVQQFSWGAAYNVETMKIGGLEHATVFKRTVGRPVRNKAGDQSKWRSMAAAKIVALEHIDKAVKQLEEEGEDIFKPKKAEA